MAHTWVTGEIITAKKLNQLEQNVASNTTNVEWARTKINGFDADNDGVVDQAETALDVSNSLMGTIVESQVEFPVAAQGESMKIIIGKFIKWMSDARTHMKTSLLTVGTKLSVTNSEVTVNDTIATSDDSKKAANTEYVKANLRRYSSTDDGTVDRARYATVAASCLNVDGHTVEADVPEDAEFTDTVDMAEMVGVLEVSHGGTGKSSVTSGRVLVGNGTSAMTEKAIDTTVTSGSSNLVTSGAVATAIAGGGGGGGSVIYATCPTSASTAQKVVTTTDGNFTLTTGASLFVKFTYANSASTPTLKVDSTTATGIRGYGTTKPSYWWKAGDVVEFVYDGSYFIMQPSQGQIYTLNNLIPSIWWNTVTGYVTKGGGASSIDIRLDVNYELKLARVVGKATTIAAFPAYGNNVLANISTYYCGKYVGVGLFNQNQARMHQGYLNENGQLVFCDVTNISGPVVLQFDFIYCYDY